MDPDISPDQLAGMLELLSAGVRLHSLAVEPYGMHTKRFVASVSIGTNTAQLGATYEFRELGFGPLSPLVFPVAAPAPCGPTCQGEYGFSQARIDGSWHGQPVRVQLDWDTAEQRQALHRAAAVAFRLAWERVVQMTDARMWPQERRTRADLVEAYALRVLDEINSQPDAGLKLEGSDGYVITGCDSQNRPVRIKVSGIMSLTNGWRPSVLTIDAVDDAAGFRMGSPLFSLGGDRYRDLHDAAARCVLTLLRRQPGC
jgi:hypothetical protein